MIEDTGASPQSDQDLGPPLPDACDFRYVWLHTSSKNGNGIEDDPEHPGCERYAGKLKLWKRPAPHSCMITFEPLLRVEQVQTDTGCVLRTVEHRQAYPPMLFENCRIVGHNERKLRIKSDAGDYLILSNDTPDKKRIESLISEGHE